MDSRAKKEHDKKKEKKENEIQCKLENRLTTSKLKQDKKTNENVGCGKREIEFFFTSRTLCMIAVKKIVPQEFLLPPLHLTPSVGHMECHNN